MKRKTKAVMAFLTAMTMTAGAMGVTAYAEETNAAVVAETSSKLVYEVDDPAYKAEIDKLYDYVPLENLVLENLNWLEDYPYLHKEPREEKWYYKHVYIDSSDFEIEHHDMETVFGAKSLQLIAEQGRADDIEAKDGKVRKFSVVDVLWTVLVADNEGLSLDELNAFLKDTGSKAHLAQTNSKQFALHFDNNDFTTKDVLDAITALNEKYGLVPGTVQHENGTYDLYYDSAYKGAMTEKTWTAYDTTVEPDEKEEIMSFSSDGVVHEDVEYHFNPETGVLLFDGEGALTYEDTDTVLQGILAKSDYTGEYVYYIVYGKNVKHDNTYPYGDDGSDYPYPGCNIWLNMMSADILPIRLCGYKNSDTEKSFNFIKNYFETVLSEQYTTHHILMIDDDVDPYDLLNGKVDIRSYDNISKNKAVTTAPLTASAETEKATVSTAKATLKGDADLNNEVSLSDVVVVSKNTLSNEAYPLANDTAYANADMNGDGKIDGLDTSALIENQLGKK